MPEGGLFSGLKFTDIFFPAAAAAASAYNPYVGRGIQTGLNTFNSFAAFRDSQRYYKRLNEEQDRMGVATEELRAGIGRDKAVVQDRLAGYDQRPDDEFGPLLDEAQTSQLGMFGDEGPELPDPDQEGLLRQELSNLEEQGPGQFDLGMDEVAMQQALQSHIRQLDLADASAVASPGSAAQHALQAGYRGMDLDYRDVDRIKDIQGDFRRRDDADERAFLERQAQLAGVQSQADIWDANARKDAARNLQYLEEQQNLSGEDGSMTPGQYSRALKQMTDQMRIASATGTAKEHRPQARFQAIQLGIAIQAAGYNLPPLMEKWLEEIAETERATELVGGGMMPSHKSTTGGIKKTAGGGNPEAVGFLNDVVPGWNG